MPEEPKIAIVILNWNSWRDTLECLDSLTQIDYRNINCLVVDNGSTDQSVRELAKWQQNNTLPMRLIKLPHNLGFAGGNNVAIKEVLTDQSNQAVLLLNNDTVVAKRFLTALASILAENPALGIVSPRIMFYDQPARIWFIGGKFNSLTGKPYHQHYHETIDGVISEIKEVDWISGCCMLIRCELLRKVGLFDADYFNNYEDVDLCVRARKAGYKFAVVTGAEVRHKFAVSVGGKHSPFYTYFRTRNNLLFFKKTGRWLPLVLNLLTFPGYAVSQSILSGNLSGVRAVWSGVRDFMSGRYGLGSAERYRR